MDESDEVSEIMEFEKQIETVWLRKLDGFFFFCRSLSLSLSLFWLNSVNEEMKRKVTWRQGNKSGH